MARSKDPAKRAAKRRRRRERRAAAELELHRGYRDGGTREREQLQEQTVKRARRCTVCKGRGQMLMRTGHLVRAAEGVGEDLRTTTCGACGGSGRAEE